MAEIVLLHDGFTNLIESVIKSETIDLEWPKSAFADGLLPGGWIVKESWRDPYRPNPMEIGNFYVINENDDNMESYKLLQRLLSNIIAKNEYEDGGMLSILYFLQTIDFVSNDSIFNYQRTLADLIPTERRVKMCSILIDLLNKYYHFGKSRDVEIYGYKEYENLFRYIQYVDQHENPTRMLSRLLRWWKESIPTLSLVSCMSPDVRVGVFEFPIDVMMSESSFVAFLEKFPQEAIFWEVVMMKPQALEVDWYTRRVFELFIQKRWMDIGKYLFMQIHIPNHRSRIMGGFLPVLLSVFDQYIGPQFTTEGQDNEIVKSVKSFTTELPAIGSWLWRYSGMAPLLSVNSATCNALCVLLTDYLQNIIVSLPHYLNKTKDVYAIWFREIYDSGVHVTLQMLQLSILAADEGNWKRLFSVFKTLCFECRCYFYGAFQSKYAARSIATHLMTLLVTNTSLEDSSGVAAMERLQMLSTIFSETLALHWIYLSERDPLLYEPEKANVILSNIELSYVLEKLPKIPVVYHGYMTTLFETIEGYRTVPWPLPNLNF
ncbi:hypothetical protein [Chitinophaga sp. Ak27]|uniref:hypothetical protein n=1 Tax=Chitinophaga sp. Ak27 TaxID=2726116 RepID=UPI00145EF4ED|nr:hypothetical protein [Chitinophaga sp. Ak27]NLU92307.1 hypothetical protein [Chitinophaga sp. Ak27]